MLKLKIINKPKTYKLKATAKFPTIKLAKMQEKEVTPTIEQQIIKPDQEFDGLSKVTIDAVTNEIDSNIVAENIKNGVEILGVSGNYVGKKYAPRFISFYGYGSSDLNDEIAGLDTTNIKNFSSMFSHCSNLTELDLKNFDTSNVTNMSEMFTYCSKLTSIDVSSFDTLKVTNMSNMFNRNTVLERLDLSNFQTNNVTNMNYIFADCKALVYLDIRNMTFNKVSFSTNAFRDVPANCEIIVKSDTERNWILNVRSDFTNIKTVAEL